MVEVSNDRLTGFYRTVRLTRRFEQRVVDDPVVFFAPAAPLPDKGPMPDGDYVVPLGKSGTPACGAVLAYATLAAAKGERWRLKTR
jgi:hypothetical protein